MRCFGLVARRLEQSILNIRTSVTTSNSQTRGGKKERDTSVGTNTSPPQGSRSALPILLLARARLRIPARGRSCSALRESAQYNAFVSRGQHGVWPLSCTESSSVRALAPGEDGWPPVATAAGWATRNGCRGRCNRRVCAVWASTVAETEGPQCATRRPKRTRRAAAARLERSCSRNRGTRWRGRCRAPGSANAAAGHALGVAGRTIGVHSGHELRAAG
jgi:hypothetical protein